MSTEEEKQSTEEINQEDIIRKQMEDKRNYVNTVLQKSHDLMVQGDKNWEQFYYKDAHTVYIQSIEGFMELMKITQDDANFQAYLKQKITYLMDKAEKCKTYLSTQMQNKKQAGYFNQNVNKEAFNLLKQVLTERTDETVQHQNRDDILKKIHDLDLADDQSATNKGRKSQEQQQSEPKEEKKKSSVDPELVKSIEESIVDHSPNIKWDDIQGLEDVKKVLKETIVLPTLRPDIFKGILSPAKGILLYGPPGNGKTLLAKAIATECKSTFFSCSAVTLTSKWMGESEKLVRALFQLAYEREPAVIFIDEIDSVMGTRGGNEHEASRRLKTEFLIQFDGVNSNSDKKVLVLAATNRPGDLDEACLRRLTRRIYMPLPDSGARKALLESKIKPLKHNITDEDMEKILFLCEGYSMADLVTLVKEVAMMPVREIPTEKLLEIKDMNDIRGIEYKDFEEALKIVAPSVSKHSILEFDQWRKDKGQV